MNFIFFGGVLALFLCYASYIADGPLTILRIVSLGAAAVCSICFIIYERQQHIERLTLASDINDLREYVSSFDKRLSQLFDTFNLVVASVIKEYVSVFEKKTDTAISAFGNTLDSTVTSKIEELHKNISLFEKKTDIALFSFANTLGSAMMEINLSRLRLAVHSEMTLKPIDSAEDWSIENENIVKSFKPGKLIQVHEKETNTDSFYQYNEDGTVTIQIDINGTKRYEITTDSNGVPIKGIEFGGEGIPQALYTYSQDGQVADRKKYN